MAQTDAGALCRRLEALEEKWRAGLAAVVQSAAQTAFEQARERVPVDTGALRRSLAVRTDGMSARVTAGTPYAAYVELGTGGARGQMPQPYMRPAFEAGAAQAARRALEVIG